MALAQSFERAQRWWQLALQCPADAVFGVLGVAISQAPCATGENQAQAVLKEVLGDLDHKGVAIKELASPDPRPV